MILLMGVGTGGVGAVSLAQYLHPNHLNYNSRLYKHLPHHSHHRSHTQSGLPIVSQYISTKLFPGFFFILVDLAILQLQVTHSKHSTR